jgi:hypothetical protein
MDRQVMVVLRGALREPDRNQTGEASWTRIGHKDNARDASNQASWCLPFSVGTTITDHLRLVSIAQVDLQRKPHTSQLLTRVVIISSDLYSDQ